MKQESKQDIILRLTEGLNAQQRSVPQLPAQAQARKISVLGAKSDPQHPFAGYAVGADEAAEPGHKVKSPDQNDPYEKGWRAGFRHDESNPYAAFRPAYEPCITQEKEYLLIGRSQAGILKKTRKDVLGEDDKCFV